ncbi:MAG: 2-oxoacid:acceptor oxidoreductase family protein [Candidatus Marinimicrobia bacterium]|jgi:2-oxoglutarate ferredoxin oxidoreductase subunit gamma|nr:2-oxoacid:acceptor oxidoreductase family protein [Candidatus Neomarinimicrobiota bacterium]MBT3634096.1 2-oxoacid:acceptor oxidoreductase family protein [Candidatus Neomarinimicrobiota bacterium]MBT3683030.1 2-oxoacid:acceptor oxidoreductase family protein [Candidatus Neomarinimicrobiota bacterium]MBT3759878.1 2-oxoacid:acceptor oxidoreductase family protein [Candidatus Neomarinimicrobiota bacterium]MBT3895669.1 2-oxoacid:acceptor oxidoreductase family protein [Candidatus Neomarinimicrobiota
MNEEIIIAGFGGQGVLSMGMTLAYSGMVEGKEVVWMPSYGPEMRGGTANCTVIVSDNKVSSPIINDYDAAIILNQPSMDKFESAVKPGGVLLYEANNIINPPTRTDISVFEIPANMEAVNLQNKKTMNMIMLGSYLGVKPIIPIDSILKALTQVLPERHHHLIPLNEKALRRGMELSKLPTEKEEA